MLAADVIATYALRAARVADPLRGGLGEVWYTRYEAHERSTGNERWCGSKRRGSRTAFRGLDT